MNHYPRHVGDFIRDTVGLSLAERGAYTALLDTYYASERPIVYAERYRLAGAVSKSDRAAVDYIMGRYFSEHPDGWRQKRADVEIDAYRQRSAKASASGVRSGEVRRERDQVNKEVRRDRMIAARSKATHTDGEWLALVEFCGAKCVECGAVGHTDKDHITPVYQGGSDGIENLQPLCARCNASKGGSAVDHRPLGWREAVAEQTLNERSTNHKPVTSNQEPESTQLPAEASQPQGQNPSASPAKKPRVKAADRTNSEAPTNAVWQAYSLAYFNRYGAEPVRNAKVNGQLSQVIARLGTVEAPEVARAFLHSNRGLYVSSRHPIDLLLRDCESLRTEWATGAAMTDTQARQADRTAATGNTFGKLINDARNGTDR